MKEQVCGFFVLIIGGLLIVFHKKFALFCAKDHCRRWGTQFSDTMVKFSEIMAIVMGITLSVLGILAFFGIIKLRGGG